MLRGASAALAAAFLLTACNKDAAGEVQRANPTDLVADQRVMLRGASLLRSDDDAPSREIRSLLNIRSPMKYGDFVWDDEGVPPGKLWVVVSLDAQTISVFRGEHEIGTAVTLYGADEKPTPIGTFPILEKRKDHWSSIYDAPMPYTLRLTYDGVAIHGSAVVAGSATNGCVGVPIDFARRLFDEAGIGDEVIVVDNLQSHIETQKRAS